LLYVKPLRLDSASCFDYNSERRYAGRNSYSIGRRPHEAPGQPRPTRPHPGRRGCHRAWRTAIAWGAGNSNLTGIWPLVWSHQVKTATTQKFVDAFTKKYGKPPENQAWGDYLSTRHIAQAMNEIKSTDSTKVVEHLEKGAKFDILKTREGYYRNWDHQLMMEMYTIRFKPAAEIKNQWDIFDTSPPVPAANAPLESIAPTREENNCTMPA
jgi:branched-chain amino acid transport system substrate-binding protein